MSSENLHEPEEKLDPATIDRHRAVASLTDGLEAVDWYDQGVDATVNTGLADVLLRNRDEEKEHASMVLEWLRRHDPVLDQHLRTSRFTDRHTGDSVQLYIEESFTLLVHEPTAAIALRYSEA
jgi:hypothetical protein